MSVSLEESPPLPRKRQRLAEGGEDVNRAYDAGRMPFEARKLWDDPSWNTKVVAVNPWRALSESGAIQKLGIKRVETQ